MEDKLYEMMDWAEIEAVVYSEENQPRNILGPHKTKDGIVIQGYFPDVVEASVKLLSDEKTVPMVQEDEGGYFAVLLPGTKIPEYRFVVTGPDGEKEEFYDAYAFPCQLDEKAQKQFEAGICYNVYEMLGAHPAVIDGVRGTCFAVWAPNAIRVSVVGDFNHWDGRMHQMHLHESGIYELFIP